LSGINVAINDHAPAIRDDDLDPTTGGSRSRFRRLRYDHRRHEPGNIAKAALAVRLAPEEKELIGNPMPAHRHRRQPRTQRTLLDDPPLLLVAPSTTATGVNNIKGADLMTVSKAVHTDSQLSPERFAKAAYTECVQ
jgi:hypothetical protein